MSPHHNNLNKRSIDCIISSSNNDSSNNEINTSNEKWNTENKNKIQKLNNLNLNHLLSSSPSQSYSQSQSQTQTLGLNIGRNSHSSAPSLHSSNSSLKSLMGNPTGTTKTTTTSVVAHGRFMATFPRRSSAPALSMVIPVLSPCTYMTISLQNKKIKPRIDSFSIEQALFFEPYQESSIKMELLQALRSSNLDQLKSYQQVKTNNNKKKKQEQQQQQQQDEKKKQENEENEKKKNSSSEAVGDENGVITDDDKTPDHDQDLRSCNQFGENLLHLACRMGIHLEILEFLIEEAQVKLNVRDRFGRTPLHNACMSALPNFNNIDYLISTQPRMVLFEDDNGKIPFDLIPQRCYERWTRFLSEQNILQRVVAAELEWDTKKGDMFE